MKKVLCIGHSAYDITMPMDKYPIENDKYHVDSLIECGGGPAGNAAYLLGKWGSSCYYAGAIGNDYYGRKIIDEFNNVNVNIDYLMAWDNKQTPVSFIIANQKNGSRTLFNYSADEMHLNNDSIDIKPDVILTDGYEVEVSMKTIKDNKDAISILDGGSFKDDTLELGKLVDYLVCSKKFAEEATKMKIKENFEAVFKKMEKIFKNNIIITLEEKGCIYKDNNKVKHMKAIKQEALDTTGTGDIFHGGFAYGLLNDYSVIDSLKIGTIAAGISVKFIGGRNSVPDLKKVLKMYKRNVL